MSTSRDLQTNAESLKKNLLTQVELEELQRDPIQGTPNVVAEENDHQLGVNIMQQLNDTEVLMEQI